MSNDKVPDRPRTAGADVSARLEGARVPTAGWSRVIIGLAVLWSLFQLWIASPLPYMFGFGIITDVPARALHLAFGLTLAFLIFPARPALRDRPIAWHDVALALLAAAATLYIFFGYDGIVRRQGVLFEWHLAGAAIPVEAIIGGVGILVLLEATRRVIGLPLVIVCALFLLYSVFGQQMPLVISHKGVSLERLIGYQWLGGEAVFGIPLSVSVSFVFLFVFFGALLERAGAGQYFLDLAFAMVGRMRGGPAKAAILASGMTGMISGSSIANVVTTGTFTIPVMRKTGLPAVKAGAIEVAASTNGQLMPPIMGAAAFIIAEFVGISYFEVIKAAFIPAVISYMALIYISHLEALKLGLRGLPRSEIPPLGATFRKGLHYLIPLAILVYLLIVKRWSPSSSVFYAILALFAIILVRPVVMELRDGGSRIGEAMTRGAADCVWGMIEGARNMVGIAIAVGAAGIIVGSVSSTGLSNALIGVMETIAGGNVYVLLGLTALLCIVLGMGLPTTANYLVVASLMAGVLVELGSAAGLVLPLIAVHLYVLFFGLLADSTPPVCLAAFAASAISGASPLRTGVQSFLYDIRTAILPVVFIFNPTLLLIGVDSVWHALVVFVASLLAILAFASLTQNWMLVRNRLWESVALVLVIFALFRPSLFMDQVYPPFAMVPTATFASGTFTAAPGQIVRFHVTRETAYGDRLKLFALPAPEAGARQQQGPFGVTLAQDESGRWIVHALAFTGPAATAGMDFADVVTAIDVEQPDLPPKEVVYLLGFALLALVCMSQYRRSRS
ncbi:TRAP transporter permease [Defluviimonas sp. WL0002]|uniref:TRAP transporter permease n=1 Tax=Albidovulum marisflavi TaxID=2984159 RepID=A0ABT2ZDQ1_9RHOB|nr:TRAP transporter permease [Defluviimonas sp. WL0002]MCV2868876.1 TRAP transporter permease [Defluviimonas sp. WL0002]